MKARPGRFEHPTYCICTREGRVEDFRPLAGFPHTIRLLRSSDFRWVSATCGDFRCPTSTSTDTRLCLCRITAPLRRCVECREKHGAPGRFRPHPSAAGTRCEAFRIRGSAICGASLAEDEAILCGPDACDQAPFVGCWRKWACLD